MFTPTHSSSSTVAVVRRRQVRRGALALALAGSLAVTAAACGSDLLFADGFE